jgi:hypothetical protein
MMIRLQAAQEADLLAAVRRNPLMPFSRPGRAVRAQTLAQWKAFRKLCPYAHV